MSKGNNVVRAKNWVFEVYPENADIRNLVYAFVPCCYSPVHSPEIDENGKKLKKHFHVLVSYPRPVSKATVQRLSDTLSGVEVFPCGSLQAYYDYMTHKNNPEKEQFPEGVKPTCLHGFSINCCDDEDELGWIFGYLLLLPQVNSYADAINCCLSERPSTLGRLCTLAYAVNSYLNSKNRG